MIIDEELFEFNANSDSIQMYLSNNRLSTSQFFNIIEEIIFTLFFWYH